MFELIAQGGQDLVQIVADTGAAWKVYQFGKHQYDHLKGFIGEKQLENARALSENTAAKLKGVDPGRISLPSPSVATPLLEAAIQESREELQDLWAALLANSMVDRGRKMRRGFIAALAGMEPIDALVLQKIAGMPYADMLTGFDVDHSIRYIFDAQNKGIHPDIWREACRTLNGLGCITEHDLGRQYNIPRLTPFGRLLLEACSVT